MVTIVVISVVLYLFNKDEHTALYEISKNVYIKTSKKNNYVVVILYSLYTTHMQIHVFTHARLHTPMHVQVHRSTVTRSEGW